MKATCTTVREYCRFDDDFQIQLEQGCPVKTRSVVQATCTLCLGKTISFWICNWGCARRGSDSLAFTMMQETRPTKSAYSLRALVTIAAYRLVTLVKTESMPVGDSSANCQWCTHFNCNTSLGHPKLVVLLVPESCAWGFIYQVGTRQGLGFGEVG